MSKKLSKRELDQLSKSFDQAKIKASHNKTDKSIMITVKTNDDKLHEIDINVAKVSSTLKEMLEACAGKDEGGDLKPIELSTIDSNTFEKIVEWCEHH